MLSCDVASLCFQNHISFTTRKHYHNALLNRIMSGSRLCVWQELHLKHGTNWNWSDGTKEADGEAHGKLTSTYSTTGYWSCFLHQSAMCRTTARSALFPVTGLANKPNKIQIKTSTTVPNVLWQANYCTQQREGWVFFTTHLHIWIISPSYGMATTL